MLLQRDWARVRCCLLFVCFVCLFVCVVVVIHCMGDILGRCVVYRLLCSCRFCFESFRLLMSHVLCLSIYVPLQCCLPVWLAQ